MIIKFKDIKKIREKHPKKKLVLASGTFDVPHAGHVLFLEDSKRHGDVLAVMLGNDESVRKAKGRERPIMNEHIRTKMIDSLKPVDYTFLSYLHKKDWYFGCLEDAFKMMRPDVYVVNFDGLDLVTRKKLTDQYGVKLITLPRTAPKEFDGISTTKIIEKIKKAGSRRTTARRKRRTH